MKKVALVLGGVSLGLLAVACSGSDEPAPFAESPSSLLDDLQAKTGSRWVADDDPETGKPFVYLALDDGKPVLSSASAPSEVVPFIRGLGPGIELDDGFVDSLDAPEVLSDASPDSNATFRFSQHVPGTKIPVLSGGLVVGVRENGSLAFLQPEIANGLRRVDVNPTLTPADAARAAAKLSSASESHSTDAPVLGIIAPDHNHPVLVYRTSSLNSEGVPVTVDVDAKTGAVVQTRIAAASAVGYAAAAGYGDKDPRFNADATLTVRGSVVRDTYAMIDSTAKIARLLAYNAEPITFFKDDVGRSYPTPTNTTYASCRADSAGDKLRCDETGATVYSAVDGQQNLHDAAEWFWKLGARQWPRGAESIPVFYHWGKAGEAFYAASSNSIYVGDGKVVNLEDGRSPQAVYPAGVAIDFMAHEYGHGIITQTTGANGTSLAFEREAGALNEGLADVFAANAKGTIRKNLGAPTTFTFAEDTQPSRQPIRNFLHPSKGTERGAVHYSQLKTLAKNEPVSPSKNDNGYVHFNSTLVSQAWALMAWGGFNDVAPNIGVTAELGFDRALRLFWNTMKSLTAADHSIKAFADKMITYQVGKAVGHPTQVDLSPYWIKHSIICAWTGVGVISPVEALARHGVTCPSALTTVQTCAGKIAGTYCDPDPRSGFASFTCSGKAASTSAGHQCPTGKYCRPSLGSVHSPAIVDSNGKPQCFDEPRSF